MKAKEICYKKHNRSKIKCEKTSCRYNINMPECENCVLIAANRKYTLQEVGDVYGVTRMRICQIEKRTLTKLGGLADHFK